MRASTLISLALALALLTSCGSNIFETIEKHDPADQALAHLDDQEPDAAIDVLEDALEDHPDDWTLVSLMASAKAQKAGVDTTQVAIQMATDGASGSGNAITSLFTVLPAATAEIVALMAEALTYLNSIPTEERVNADTFKLSLFNTAFTALQTKYFDQDGNGAFTAEELAQLDEASAILIFEGLLQAENAAASYTAGDSTGQAAQKISAITSSINAQPGATTGEKLKSYLATTAKLTK